MRPFEIYCQQAGIEFTRCRPYRKNDQAWVEQKNGAVVRRTIGYRRFEGLEAAAALARLYAAPRSRSAPRALPHRKSDGRAAGHNAGSPGQLATDASHAYGENRSPPRTRPESDRAQPGLPVHTVLLSLPPIRHAPPC